MIDSSDAKAETDGADAKMSVENGNFQEAEKEELKGEANDRENQPMEDQPVDESETEKVEKEESRLKFVSVVNTDNT